MPWLAMMITRGKRYEDIPFMHFDNNSSKARTKDEDSNFVEFKNRWKKGLDVLPSYLPIADRL